MVIRHDNEIKVIQESLNKMNKTQEYDGIFFKGQVYDSYSLMIKILSKAKKKITIIDNYIDNINIGNYYKLTSIAVDRDEWTTLIVDTLDRLINNQDFIKRECKYEIIRRNTF
jgi:hypothetical protein